MLERIMEKLTDLASRRNFLSQSARAALAFIAALMGFPPTANALSWTYGCCLCGAPTIPASNCVQTGRCCWSWVGCCCNGTQYPCTECHDPNKICACGGTCTDGNETLKPSPVRSATCGWLCSTVKVVGSCSGNNCTCCEGGPCPGTC